MSAALAGSITSSWQYPHLGERDERDRHRRFRYVRQDTVEADRHRHERACLSEHAGDQTCGVVEADLGRADNTHGLPRQAPAHEGRHDDIYEILDRQRPYRAGGPIPTKNGNVYRAWLRW